MDKIKFWKTDSLETNQSTTPEYDLGARSFDNNSNNNLNSQFGSPMTTPIGSDPLTHGDPLSQPMNQFHADPFGAMPGQEQPSQFSQSPTYPQAQPFPGSQAQQYSAQHTQQNNQQFSNQEHHLGGQEVHPRDVELILAKLDGIKSEIDSLHMRVKKIEQYYDAATPAQQSNQNTQQKHYW